MKYKTIIDCVNNTPLVFLKNTKKKYQLKSNIFAKLESFNASGSIKARIAKEIILNGLKNGLINQSTPIIEASSGNTAIGLAFICAYLNLKLYVIMLENTSIEKQKLVKLYGGEVVLIPKKDGIKKAIKKAQELKEKLNGFIPSQFENPLNPLTHEKYTAREIYDQLNSKVDIVVSGIGTGGTITGIAKYLKSKKDVKIIAIEPSSSPLLTKGYSSNHNIEGIGPNIVPKNLDLSYIDEIMLVDEKDAEKGLKQLMSLDGISCGLSSGATYYCALKIAKEEKNKNIVIILPDNAERYLSKINV